MPFLPAGSHELLSFPRPRLPFITMPPNVKHLFSNLIKKRTKTGLYQLGRVAFKYKEEQLSLFSALLLLSPFNLPSRLTKDNLNCNYGHYSPFRVEPLNTESKDDRKHSTMWTCKVHVRQWELLPAHALALSLTQGT